MAYLNKFVDNNSDLNLLKSINKSGLVQVQRTVNGKYGTYTRMQWVKMSDMQASDRLVHTPAYSMKQSEADARNAIEENNSKAKLHTVKYRKGTVVEITVPDRKNSRQLRTVTGIVVSVGTTGNRSRQFSNVYEISGTSIQIKDSKGNVYSINSMNPKAQINKVSKAHAEKFLGRKIFPHEYFIKNNNESHSFTEEEVIQYYNTHVTDPHVSFDSFVRQTFLDSDGYCETMHVYKQQNGEYIPSRQKLHQSIIKNIVDSADTPAEGEKPVCFLFGGGSASGKSSVVNPIMKDTVADLGVNFARVDSDEIKKSIPEYQSFQEQNPDKAAYRVHNESSDIANAANDALIAAGKCFAFDGTMKNEAKYVDLIERLKAAGYTICIIGVDIPTQEAISRAEKRAKLENRSVPLGIIKGSHGGFADTFPKIKDLVDKYQLYDNSQAEGQPATLICDKSGVKNEELWQRFLKKGQDYVNSKGGHKHGK